MTPAVAMSHDSSATVQQWARACVQRIARCLGSIIIYSAAFAYTYYSSNQPQSSWKLISNQNHASLVRVRCDRRAAAQHRPMSRVLIRCALLAFRVHRGFFPSLLQLGWRRRARAVAFDFGSPSHCRRIVFRCRTAPMHRVHWRS